jgi:hypothetical protein
MPGTRSGGSRRAEDQTEKENIMLEATLETVEIVAATLPLVVEDEMDAPADWDSGTVTFDPYL